MAREIETKVLDIDESRIRAQLSELGASIAKDTRLFVDWYRRIGTREGTEPWFLRIRSDAHGNHEVTWKAKSKIEGNVRHHQEINFSIQEPGKLAELFRELELERYAHQEKDRTTFTYKEWIFDLDCYPGMPPFLEIEGISIEQVQEGMRLLGVEHNRTWTDGERTLIQDVYGLNWYEMRF